MKINRERITAVLDKELIELWKNKLLVASMIALPILMFLMSVGTMLAMIYLEDDGGSSKDSGDIKIAPEFAKFGSKIAVMILMNEQYMFYYLMIPAILPLMIAAYSIIGEKEIKSLEPLLATPITIQELLLGKSLSAIAIPVFATWLCYGLNVLIVIFTAPAPVFTYMARPAWLLGIGLLSPLLAFLSVLLGIIISSRVNDTRVAQQLGGLIVLPIVAGSIVVLLGQLYITLLHIVLTLIMLASITLIVYIIAIDLFERENILTKWK